jgi:hypothetical protein
LRLRKLLLLPTNVNRKFPARYSGIRFPSGGLDAEEREINFPSPVSNLFSEVQE